jgi:hypothetical protein
MRAAAVVLLAACSATDVGPEGVATDAEIRDRVTCNSDWSAPDVSNGCDAPCENKTELSPNLECRFELDALGVPVEASCEEGFILWRGRRGCCILHRGGDENFVQFHECQPL